MKITEDHERKDDINPVTKTFRDAPRFNNAWLSAGAHYTATQRIGFTLLSILVAFAGALFCQNGIILFREGMVSGFLPLLGGTFALYLGGLGVFRVGQDIFSRKPRTRKNDPASKRRR